MKQRFNRYMVECEYSYRIYVDSSVTGFNRYMVECELESMFVNDCYASGFNRYMVECECKGTSTHFISIYVLIDTWWNVNLAMGTLEKT